MKEFVWVQRLIAPRMAAWLAFFKDGEARVFSGGDIPGWVVVKSRKRDTHDGLWTPNIWKMVLAEGVFPVYGHFGEKTGDYPEGFWSVVRRRGPIPASWAEWRELLADTVGVSGEEARVLLLEMDPFVAEEWDAAEEKMGGFEDTAVSPPEPHPSVERNRLLLTEVLPPAATSAPTDAVTVVFYGPFRGDAKYDAPIEVVRDGRVVGRVIPLPPGPMAAGQPTQFWWAAARVTGAVCFESIEFVGTYVNFRLLIPEGSELRHPTLRRVAENFYGLEIT